MKRYIVELSQQAENDIDRYIDFIIFEYHAPLTGTRHYNGLFDVIKLLTVIAELFPISNSPKLQQFGFNVRKINYHKMSIIYTVHDNIVYIHTIFPQGLLTGL